MVSYYRESVVESLSSLTLPRILRALNWLTFVISFSFAIYNCFITLLMLSYNITDTLDCLVWTIPIFLTLLLRPYIITLTLLKSKHINLITIISLGMLGCSLVILSADKSFIIKQYRILCCCIGWILHYTCFEVAQIQIYMIVKQMEKEYGYFYDEENSFDYENNGSIVGYICPTMIAFVFRGNSKIVCLYIKYKFFRVCAYCYFMIVTLAAFAVIVVYLYTRKINTNKTKSNVPTSTTIKLNNPEHLQISSSWLNYFHLLFKFLRSSNKARLISFRHFLMNFIQNTVFIYTTLWIKHSYIDHSEGFAAIKGVWYGSLALLIIQIIKTMDLKVLSSNASAYNVIMLIQVIVGFIGYYHYERWALFALVVVVGFTSKMYDYQLESYSDALFEIVQLSIEKLSDLVILCMMPTVALKILGNDDTEDSLCWIASMSLLLLLLNYSLYHDKKKNNKKPYYKNIYYPNPTTTKSNKSE